MYVFLYLNAFSQQQRQRFRCLHCSKTFRNEKSKTSHEANCAQSTEVATKPTKIKKSEKFEKDSKIRKTIKNVSKKVPKPASSSKTLSKKLSKNLKSTKRDAIELQKQKNAQIFSSDNETDTKSSISSRLTGGSSSSSSSNDSADSADSSGDSSDSDSSEGPITPNIPVLKRVGKIHADLEDDLEMSDENSTLKSEKEEPDDGINPDFDAAETPENEKLVKSENLTNEATAAVPEIDDSNRPVFDTIVNCSCGITKTDSFINPVTNEPRLEIECDSCYTWQHVFCVINREPENTSELDNIKYICKNCVKRKYRTNKHEWLIVDMLETGYIPCLDENIENSKIVNGAWWETRKWERSDVEGADLGPDLPGKPHSGKSWVNFKLKDKLRDLAFLKEKIDVLVGLCKMVQDGQDDRECWLENFENLTGLSDLVELKIKNESAKLQKTKANFSDDEINMLNGDHGEENSGQKSLENDQISKNTTTETVENPENYAKIWRHMTTENLMKELDEMLNTETTRWFCKNVVNRLK